MRITWKYLCHRPQTSPDLPRGRDTEHRQPHDSKKNINLSNQLPLPQPNTCNQLLLPRAILDKTIRITLQDNDPAQNILHTTVATINN